MKSILPVVVIVFILAAGMTIPASAVVYYSASTPQIITKGDAFSVSGTGAVNGTIALWIIGRNYFEVRSISPDRHGNFSLVFKPTETVKFLSGEYAIVLQDPGPSGTMEIEPGRDSEGNLTIMNRGKIIARLGAQESLKGNVRTETGALLSSALLKGVDDSFLPEYFFVEEPSIHFDDIIPASGSRLPDKVSGSPIVITGITNIGKDDTIQAEIRTAGSDTLITSKTLQIIHGSSLNRWIYQLDEPGLKPGNYRIFIVSSDSRANSSAQFAVMEEPVPGSPPFAAAHPSQGEEPLSGSLVNLLLIGMVFVFAVVVYTITKK